MVRYSIKADRLYPWLLVAVFVSVVGMVAWQSLSMTHSSSQALPWLRLMQSYLGMSLSFVAMLTLVMMEVSFASAFDFIRAGQSVYGGVFCTPGALSAYRAETLKPLLAGWSVQTFMGKPANIGEDRALTNLVIASGLRVVYQREAVVLTKVPVRFQGLRRMLLRWARSNVRENLVMFGYVFGRFRTDDGGSGWVRLFSVTQMMRMTFTEAFKCAVCVQLVLEPLGTPILLVIGTVLSSILPSIVHHQRHGGWFGLKWSLPFSFFWMACLWWIPLWGIFTASQSGWLTRGAPDKAPQFQPAAIMAASAGVAPPKISARAA